DGPDSGGPGGAGMFAQPLAASDVALLLGGPNAPSGFRLNTGVPAANSTESRAAGLTDLTAVLEGSRRPAGSAALMSNVASTRLPEARLDAPRDVLDEVFSSPDLFPVSSTPSSADPS